MFDDPGLGHTANGSSGSNGNARPKANANPPAQNLEAERGSIGSVLLDNRLIDEIAVFLRPEHFFRDSHQVIYQAILDRYRNGFATDVITLADELILQGLFDKAGGDKALTEIIESVPHAANGVYYAQIVLRKAIARDLETVGHQIIHDCRSNLYTAEELIETAEREIFRVGDIGVSDSTVRISEGIDMAVDRLVKRERGISGISTGLSELDALTDGLQDGNLIILAARPSMGKTQIALNWLEHATAVNGHSALLVSLEMGRSEIGERLLVSHARVDNHKLRIPEAINEKDWVRINETRNTWKNARLFIDDTPARTTIQIMANARRHKARHGIRLLVVDYLQLIDTKGTPGDSREERVAGVSRDLKKLARELQIPVIAVAQLNRAAEKREEHRPRMGDLRESGAIEQDADLVLLLHRPEYYDPNEQPGVAELIVAKNRNGPTGTAKLVFLKSIGRFENLADTENDQAAIDSGY